MNLKLIERWERVGPGVVVEVDEERSVVTIESGLRWRVMGWVVRRWRLVRGWVTELVSRGTGEDRDG